MDSSSLRHGGLLIDMRVLLLNIYIQILDFGAQMC